MAEEKFTVGGQPVIDNVPLHCEPSGASDYCMHCGRSMCNGDYSPCKGLERARRQQIDPDTVIAFGCRLETEGAQRCNKWCKGLECAYAREYSAAKGEQTI